VGRSLIVAGGTVIAGGSNTAVKLKEWHGNADMGAGYDIISGPADLQLKFGLRISDVSATTNANTVGSISGTLGGAGFSVSGTESATKIRSFLGIGPRIGMSGSIPLSAGWTLDYAGDAALLFGNTKIDTNPVTSFAINAPGVPLLIAVSGIPNSAYWSKPTTVANGDFTVGFGYWITQYTKFTIAGRVDAYLDALRASPDDTLPAQSIDRFFYGATVGLTSKFN
jgi:hypothetical protein